MSWPIAFLGTTTRRRADAGGGAAASAGFDLLNYQIYASVSMATDDLTNNICHADFGETGKSLYLTNSLNDRVVRLRGTNAYRVSTFTSLEQFDIPGLSHTLVAVNFNTDGTKFYSLDTNLGAGTYGQIRTWICASAWQVSGATESATQTLNLIEGDDGGNWYGFRIDPGGNHMYTWSRTTPNAMKYWHMGNAWEISAASAITSAPIPGVGDGWNNNVRDMVISSAGSRMYVIGGNTGNNTRIHQFELDPAYEISAWTTTVQINVSACAHESGFRLSANELQMDWLLFDDQGDMIVGCSGSDSETIWRWKEVNGYNYTSATSAAIMVSAVSAVAPYSDQAVLDNGLIAVGSFATDYLWAMSYDVSTLTTVATTSLPILGDSTAFMAALGNSCVAVFGNITGQGDRVAHYRLSAGVWQASVGTTTLMPIGGYGTATYIKDNWVAYMHNNDDLYTIKYSVGTFVTVAKNTSAWGNYVSLPDRAHTSTLMSVYDTATEQIRMMEYKSDTSGWEVIGSPHNIGGNNTGVIQPICLTSNRVYFQKESNTVPVILAWNVSAQAYSVDVSGAAILRLTSWPRRGTAVSTTFPITRISQGSWGNSGLSILIEVSVTTTSDDLGG